MTARYAAPAVVRSGRAPARAPRTVPGAPALGSASVRSAAHPVPLAWVLGRLVVRRWASSMGTSSCRLVSSVTIGLLVVGVTAHRVVGSWPPAHLAGSESVGSSEALLLVVTISLFFGAAAFGIFAARSRSLPRSLSALRTLPVSARDVDRAGALPVLAVGGGFAIALLPAVGIVTTRLTGRGPVHGLLLLGLVLAGGAAGGRLLLALADRLLPWPGASALRLTASYLAWTLLLGLSLVGPSTLLVWADGPAGLLLLAPLCWPLGWWALVDPAPGVVAGAVAVSGSLWWAARRVDPRSTIWGPGAATRAAVGVRPIHFARPFPLVRFEARRLVRNPRTLEAMVVSGFCALAVVVAVAWMGHRTPASVDPLVVALLGAQVAGGFGVTGRGLSSRRRPVEALLGMTPRRHLLALFTATLAVAVLVSGPAVLGASLSLPAGAVLSWLASLPVYVAVALLVSVVLTPEPGNGASEAGAVMVYAAAAAAALTLLGRHGPVVSVVLGALLMATALAASVAIERRHRRPT